MKKTLLAAVATFAATSAFAADLPVRYNKAPPPVAVQVFSWTGFYIGGHIGGASARHESAQIADPTDGVDFHDYPGGRETGVFGGVQAGYNWQFNNVVLGIEGDVGYLGIRGQRTLPAIGVVDDGSVSTVKYGAYGVIAGRLGLAFDRSLLYVKGGAAFAEIRNRSYEIGDGGVGIEFDEDHRVSKTHTGWALGAGYEYAFAPNWTGKIEYLHMDFGHVSTTNLEGDVIRFRNEVDTVKIGFNYRFGGPVVARY